MADIQPYQVTPGYFCHDKRSKGEVSVTTTLLSKLFYLRSRQPLSLAKHEGGQRLLRQNTEASMRLECSGSLLLKPI